MAKQHTAATTRKLYQWERLWLGRRECEPIIAIRALKRQPAQGAA